VMKQVTVRMEGQDGLTQREEDEWSEVCVWMTVFHGRGAEGHV
jgi:hypothetical protein